MWFWGSWKSEYRRQRLGSIFRSDDHVIMHACEHTACLSIWQHSFSSLYCRFQCARAAHKHTDADISETFFIFFYMWKHQHRWLVLRVLHLFIYSFSVEHLREMKTKQVCLFGMPMAPSTLRGLSWDNRFLQDLATLRQVSSWTEK